jgi:hypothetical protein
MKTFKNRWLIFCGLILMSVASTTQAASSYTYSYNGPMFAGGTDRISVSFTTATPLAASKSYLNLADAGVTGSSVTVVGQSGALPYFTFPITNFQLHTNSTGSIDSWFIFGGINTLGGAAPLQTGSDWQAYTMNTLSFIPGSDIAGATGLVMGRYAYDQATETSFYKVCTSVHPTCTLAGNGQPYVGNYSGIINPSNTNGSWWTVKTDNVTPPLPQSNSSAITISGVLPKAIVDVNYASTETATGGTPYNIDGKMYYRWFATGLPRGFAINKRTGTIYGSPKTPGQYSVLIKARDKFGIEGTASYTLIVSTGNHL